MDKFVTGSNPLLVRKNSNDLVKSKKLADLPWVEKYRPKKVDDVAHQDEIVAVLKKVVLEGSDLPNFLFYGPPGTGKTSCALAVAKELFGNENYRERVLELNASDERGIQVIREKVKRFAQYSTSEYLNGKQVLPLKIIILDEADSMTNPAQAALRRTMERESKTTRFFLICNYISRIIDPLTSRCAKFRFKPLPNEALNIRLKDICTAEGARIAEEALQVLMDASEGDLRKAITFLQTCTRYAGDNEITVQDINEAAGVLPNSCVDGFIEVCQRGSYEKVEKYIKVIMREGYSGYQVLLELHNLLLKSTDLMDQNKATVFEKLAICDQRLMDGADEYLQLIDFACVLMIQYEKIKI